ncbi:MAG: 4Fe-4S binding protein [Granulosicoccaceae bacterium]
MSLIKIGFLFLSFFWVFCSNTAVADRVDEQRVRDEVIAPYSLGPQTSIEGVWELLNGSGLQEGYVIETEAISALPGFSGAAINMFVLLDLDGVFIDVKLLNQNEPIFVSGLGEAPFREFLNQYRGLSISTPLSVGSSYGAASQGSLTYLDGVTKATASVRVAHESILAAAREVARQKLEGLSAPAETVEIRQDLDLELTWSQLVERGYAQHLTATHGEVRQLFSQTRWRDDDPFDDRADEELYVDLWVLDVSAPSVAKAVMSPRMLQDWERFGDVAPQDETILLIESADHGLVSEDFIRNTAPALVTATQGGFPVSLRDADLLIELKDDVPEGRTMVLRADRRLGFNPTRDWELSLIALRERGMFRPEIGQIPLSWNYHLSDEFFIVHRAPEPLSPFASAIAGRLNDLIFLAGFLLLVVGLLVFNRRLVKWPAWGKSRLAVLLITLGFVGWWGQGQLSIVTPLAAFSTLLQQRSLSFLLYDPFSLLIWVVVIASFLWWGRALFCGWLCPFGALQEFVAVLATQFKIKQVQLPALWDTRLRWIKYVLLFGLLVTAVFQPQHVDLVAEVEPFKTAISVFFVREWYYVLYAVLCLLASVFVFKAYCRYLCPLGALMAIGGFLRLKPWIDRRAECGSPCQLCQVKCRYGAIVKTGEVQYSECFGCLDCVDIYQDNKKCAPLIVANKKSRSLAPKASV